jgi:hypothetical protein
MSDFAEKLRSQRLNLSLPILAISCIVHAIPIASLNKVILGEVQYGTPMPTHFMLQVQEPYHYLCVHTHLRWVRKYLLRRPIQNIRR